MNLLSLVSYDMIRSVAGLTRADVSDAVLESLPIEMELTIDFEDWLPEADAIFDGLWAETSPGLRDSLIRRLTIYSTYFGAAVLCQAAPGLMLKKLSDGINIGERFSSVDPSKLSDAMLAKALVHKESIIATFNPAAATDERSFFSTVAPSYDPVVGS